MNTKNVESYLRDNYDRRLLFTYRSAKKYYLRIGTVGLDIYFLKSCRSKDIMPKFLWFKTANKNLGSSSAYKECQRRLLNVEINYKYKHLYQMKKMYHSAINVLKQDCSEDLFQSLQQIMIDICCPVIKDKEKTVEKSHLVIVVLLYQDLPLIEKLSQISRHEYCRMMKSIVELMVLTTA